MHSSHLLRTCAASVHSARGALALRVGRTATAIRPIVARTRDRCSTVHTRAHVAAGASGHDTHVAASAVAAAPASAVDPHAGYAGLFAYPFGLHGQAEALLDEYRACSDATEAQSILSAIQRQVMTESHALELDEHLQGKCGSDDRVNALYVELASRVDILHAEVTQLSDTMLMEKFDKRFVLYPPSADAAPVNSDSVVPLVDGVRFDVQWTTHRHLVRQELAPCEHHARIMVTPFRVSTGEDGEVRSEDLTAIRLMESSDGGRSHVDLAALEQIRLLYGGPVISQRQFVWFISFLASHPSDFAFDVVSGVLEARS